MGFSAESTENPKRWNAQFDERQKISTRLIVLIGSFLLLFYHSSICFFLNLKFERLYLQKCFPLVCLVFCDAINSFSKTLFLGNSRTLFLLRLLAGSAAKMEKGIDPTAEGKGRN